MLDAFGRRIMPDKAGQWQYRNADGKVSEFTIVMATFADGGVEPIALGVDNWHTIYNFDWIGPAEAK